MRGRERNRVAAVLLLSSSTTGALAGFALGALWRGVGLPVLGLGVAVAVVGATTLADVVHVRPLAVGRQVPQEWGRLFDPSTTALLYGARLGVGPLTILATWWWWAATIVAASAGAGPSALAGSVFGAGRVVVMIAVSARAASAMPARIARVRAVERRVRSVLTVACAAIVAAALLTSCSSDSEKPRATARSTTSTTSAPASTSTTVAPEASDQQLAAALLSDPGPGFHPVDDPAHTGPLDLDAASHAEADVRAERALLQTRGFVRGYQRSWANGTDRSVLVAIYRFATAEGAAAYQQDGIITATGYGAQPFDVPAVPGAKGMSEVGSGARGSTVAHAVVFTKGDRFFLVVVTSTNSSATPDDARALALKQSQAA